MTKYMKLDCFRELGYLQEVNRRLLHPLGLELTIVGEGKNQTLKVLDARKHQRRIGGINQQTDRDQGLYFPREIWEQESFGRNAEFITRELKRRRVIRQSRLGFHIQPIGVWPLELQLFEEGK